ncbi:MAG: archaetidylserine decarboxylase [Pseudomonadota bacterium]
MSGDRESALTWRQKSFAMLQYFLPQIAMTRGVGWLMQREQPWLKNLLINNFIKLFKVDTQELDAAAPDAYASLNAFFIRELAADARPIDADPDSLTSPADGVVSASGSIKDGMVIQAKGFTYSATDLLGNAELAERFNGGVFATIYLAPYNYHRVHTPVAGEVVEHRHIPGKLFSVNGATARAVPKLFSRNERRVFDLAGTHGHSALVMVGALNVGSISTVWDGYVAAGSKPVAIRMALPPEPFAKGATVGWFNMGSTVIMLFEAGAARWHDDFAAGAIVRVGQPIGRLTPNANR